MSTLKILKLGTFAVCGMAFSLALASQPARHSPKIVGKDAQKLFFQMEVHHASKTQTKVLKTLTLKEVNCSFQSTSKPRFSCINPEILNTKKAEIFFNLLFKGREKAFCETTDSKQDCRLNWAECARFLGHKVPAAKRYNCTLSGA